MKLRALLLLACLVLAAAACEAAEEVGGEAADPAATDEAAEPGATAEDAAGDDGAAADERPDRLVLGLVPSREADVLVENAEPLAEALSERLGVEVESFVPTDYTGLTEAMASGQADIGAFGPLGVVRAMDRAGVEFIAQSERFGSLTYHTQYMTNNPDKYCMDEPVADENGFLFCNGTLEAEEGPVGEDAIAMIDGSLAFVDPSSTSGFLIPSLQMLRLGVDPQTALETTFAGGHDNAVLAVYNGDVEVGLAFDDARTIVAEEFPDVGEEVVVFAYSQEIPNDGFTVRGDLPDEFQQEITDALLDYASTEEGQEVLNSIYEIDNLVPADDAALDVVREADEELGDLILEE